MDWRLYDSTNLSVGDSSKMMTPDEVCEYANQLIRIDMNGNDGADTEEFIGWCKGLEEYYGRPIKDLLAETVKHHGYVNVPRIDSFRGEYFFLSNFFPCRISYGGMIYASSEHAFQAQKTKDLDLRREFTVAFKLTAGIAKRRGRSVPLRGDWENIKLTAMSGIIHSKFSNPDLRQRLVATFPALLIEGNDWGDHFFGVCDGYGENHLGRILMRERLECLNEKNK